MEQFGGSKFIGILEEREIFSSEEIVDGEEEIFRSGRSIRQDFSPPRIVSCWGGGGKIVGIGTHGGSSAKQHNTTSSSPPRAETRRPEMPGCKTSAASLAKPGDVYAEEGERRREFSVLPELLSRKSFLSHFSPRFRGDVFASQLVQFPAASMTRRARAVSVFPAWKSTGMLFALGFLSPVFLLSLSLFVSSNERAVDGWLVLLLLLPPVSRTRAVHARNSRRPQAENDVGCVTRWPFTSPRASLLDGFIVGREREKWRNFAFFFFFFFLSGLSSFSSWRIQFGFRSNFGSMDGWQPSRMVGE